MRGVRAGPCLSQAWIVITQGNVRVSREISFELGIPKAWIWKPLNLHNFSPLVRGFAHSSVGKESAYNAGDPGLIPGLGRCPGERNGNPLQYSCLENPMDRGAWQATAHGVKRIGHNLATKPPPPLVRTTQRLQGRCSVGKICILSWVSQSVSSTIQSCLTLRPCRLQQVRLPCPSPTPGACSNSCSSSQWCHPTISSSVVPFSSCLQSFPAWGSFPMS